MKSEEIRHRFLKFFENRGHKIIPSASLVPENDPSVLFNTAGMQPLVPYLLGEVHPMGKRIVNIQKCVRTVDLEDIGDNRHLSFFEMMGNWSLGDYFKEEAIAWSYQFLTSKEEGLGLDPKGLYVTVFKGDDNAPKDIETFEIWKRQGIKEDRIYFLSAEDNWWSPGDNGPCGPCSEMFYDVSLGVGDLSETEFLDAIKREEVIEIWNDVFMEYEKKDGKVIGKLKNKNVDTGAGLERMTAVLQGKKNAYETDIFLEVIDYIKENSISFDIKVSRIIADHLRTAVFLIADGVLPSNKNQGYILRRLIRRAIFKMANTFQGKEDIGVHIIEMYIKKYLTIYDNLDSKKIVDIFKEEERKFTKTLNEGRKEFERGVDPFMLFTTYGFPVELTEELLKEKGLSLDKDDFDKKMSEHQKLSQTASAGMFRGGLANSSEKTIKLHTTHHLLLAALQNIVGKNVKQKGSNITEDRLRMDFVCDHKLTEEEKKKIEEFVNEKIRQELRVERKEMPLIEAEKIGAEMEFGAKYPNTVSVYFILDENNNEVSKEFCGGPHVKNTKEIGVDSDGSVKHFKILKEEAVSSGVRRIKAVLE